MHRFPSKRRAVRARTIVHTIRRRVCSLEHGVDHQNAELKSIRQVLDQVRDQQTDEFNSIQQVLAQLVDQQMSMSETKSQLLPRSSPMKKSSGSGVRDAPENLPTIQENNIKKSSGSYGKDAPEKPPILQEDTIIPEEFLVDEPQEVSLASPETSSLPSNCKSSCSLRDASGQLPPGLWEDLVRLLWQWSPKSGSGCVETLPQMSCTSANTQTETFEDCTPSKDMSLVQNLAQELTVQIIEQIGKQPHKTYTSTNTQTETLLDRTPSKNMSREQNTFSRQSSMDSSSSKRSQSQEAAGLKKIAQLGISSSPSGQVSTGEVSTVKDTSAEGDEMTCASTLPSTGASGCENLKESTHKTEGPMKLDEVHLKAAYEESFETAADEYLPTGRSLVPCDKNENSQGGSMQKEEDGHTPASLKSIIQSGTEPPSAASRVRAKVNAMKAMKGKFQLEKDRSLESEKSTGSDKSAPVQDRKKFTQISARPKISAVAMKRQKSFESKQLFLMNSWIMRNLGKVVNSDFFSYFFGFLILANSLTIGMQADYVAKHVNGTIPAAYGGLETFFCFAFLIELILKIIVFGRGFLFEDDESWTLCSEWRWNVFDTVVVTMALVEEIPKAVPAFKDSSSVNLTFIRILRIIRIVRIIRFIRVLKFFRELRVLIHSIVGSLKSLCWTILLLMVCLYVVAVYITQLVAEHRAEVLAISQTDGEYDEELDKMYAMFGSVAQSLYTLYKAMSGGTDWGDVSRPLETYVHFLFAPFFCAYIAFTVFAVLNVVTGVFVNEAMHMASKDQELVIEDELSRKDSDINEFIRMFHEADADGNGSVTWDEFAAHMEDDRVKAYFKVLDVNLEQAEQMFLLCEQKNEGGDMYIAIDDFVNACIKMKGSAKSIDVQTLLYLSRAMMRDMKEMKDQVDSIKPEEVRMPGCKVLGRMGTQRALRPVGI